jgi:hypothetical protein
MEDLSAFSAKPRLRLLLDHFSQIKDTRQSWKVAYPLREVCSWSSAPRSRTAMTTTRSSIGANANLAFLRGLSEFYHGIPCVDWLRLVMNRLDPDLFRACFSSWVQPAGRTSSPCGDRWQDLAPRRAPASRSGRTRAAARHVPPAGPARSPPDSDARQRVRESALRSELAWLARP